MFRQDATSRTSCWYFSFLAALERRRAASSFSSGVEWVVIGFGGVGAWEVGWGLMGSEDRVMAFM
jgi:hypothetical protein